MTKKQTNTKKREKEQRQHRQKQLKMLLVGMIGLLGVGFVLWQIGVLPFTGGGQSITNPNASLASFYAPEVMRWQSDIKRWAREYDVNPNVIAIVMQIESCGHPSVISHAGATGLMQVMPFHFANGENMLNPDTNMRRGMLVFYECLEQFANWDLGIALACYNGGPSVTQSPMSSWPRETQSYYRWATGLWDDVRQGNEDSSTLSEWLDAGGQALCTRAASVTYQPRD